MPRLIGAFILFSALLFFVQSTAMMFNSWDNLKKVNDCLYQKDFSREFCQQLALESVGIYVGPDQSELSMRQFWSVILGPIATILLWLAVLFFGWMIYKTGDLVIPVEESVRFLHEERQKKH